MLPSLAALQIGQQPPPLSFETLIEKKVAKNKDCETLEKCGDDGYFMFKQIPLSIYGAVRRIWPKDERNKQIVLSIPGRKNVVMLPRPDGGVAEAPAKGDKSDEDEDEDEDEEEDEDEDEGEEEDEEDEEFKRSFEQFKEDNSGWVKAGGFFDKACRDQIFFSEYGEELLKYTDWYLLDHVDRTKQSGLLFVSLFDNEDSKIRAGMPYENGIWDKPYLFISLICASEEAKAPLKGSFYMSIAEALAVRLGCSHIVLASLEEPAPYYLKNGYQFVSWDDGKPIPVAVPESRKRALPAVEEGEGEGGGGRRLRRRVSVAAALAALCLS